MPTIARDVLWPKDSKIVFRAVILNVGQGSSTVCFARDGKDYQTILEDINLHKNVGINIPNLMKDLLDGEPLDLFINSHPHDDHLCGVTELSDVVKINEVWHAGHRPSKNNEAAYKDLQALIKKVKEEGGDEVELDSSRYPTSIGEVNCYILAPAEHVKDDISDETPEGRDQRIHEHCAVLRFGLKDSWVMIPGDADLDAWKLHITDYHGSRMTSTFLVAAHHGSRSYFKKSKDDEPYLDALKKKDPHYVIVSAPKPNENRHKHPHDDAMKLYEDQVGAENVYHTGKDRYCFICDIYEDGSTKLSNDSGDLTKHYPYSDDTSEGDDGSTTKRASMFGSTPRVSPAPPFA